MVCEICGIYLIPEAGSERGAGKPSAEAKGLPELRTQLFNQVLIQRESTLAAAMGRAAGRGTRNEDSSWPRTMWPLLPGGGS